MHFSTIVTLLAATTASVAASPCDCGSIVYAKDVEPYYTPITDSGEHVDRQGVPLPITQSNEPIAPGIPDLRGFYKLPAAGNGTVIEVGQAGNRVQLRVPRTPELQTSIARDFILDGEGRNALFADFLNVGTQGAGDEPTVIATEKFDDEKWVVRRFSQPNSNEFFGSTKVNTTALGQPFGVVDAFLITQVAILGTAPPFVNAIPFLKLPNLPQQVRVPFVPAQCIEECQAAERAPKEVVQCGPRRWHRPDGFDPRTQRCFGSHPDDFPVQRTPCNPAIYTNPGAFQSIQDCSFKTQPNAPPTVPLALEGCRVRIPRNRPDLRGEWELSDGSALRVEQCGDRIVLLIDNDVVFDARTARRSDGPDVRRDTGAFGVEPRSHSPDKFRLAAYTLTTTRKEFHFQSIALGAAVKKLRAIRASDVPSGEEVLTTSGQSAAWRRRWRRFRNGQSRIENIEFSYYDFGTQEMKTLYGVRSDTSDTWTLNDGENNEGLP